LGAAVIDDVLVIIMLAFAMSFGGGDVSLGGVILKKIIFFVTAIIIGWKIVPPALEQLAPLRVTQTVISAGLITCFIFAYMAEIAGVAPIIGAYIAGIAISTTDFKHKVFEKVETIGYAIFVPVFFTSIGVTAEFIGLGGYIWLAMVLTIVAVLAKLVGSGIGAKLAGFSWKSAAGIGVGMAPRGEVTLIIASVGLSSGLIADKMFAVIVIVVLAATLVTPPLMKVFFSRT